MALLRKNIWMLFILLFAGSLLFLITLSYLHWKTVNEEHRTKQENLIRLVSHASHSLFTNQEIILDILGAELIKDPDYLLGVKTQPLLDHLLTLNPAIVGFGLARPDGKLTFVSSNFNLGQLPNLLQQLESRESFLLALKSNRMVLGRTYYMEAVGEWLIPIRKAIRDKQGHTLGVMTAGLRINGASRLFNSALHMGEFNRVTLIRGQDAYPQLHSSEAADMQLDYEKMVSRGILERAFYSMELETGLSIEQIKAQEIITPFRVRLSQWTSVGAARFDRKYNLWVVSEIKLKKIIDDFFDTFSIYFLVFIIGQIIIYKLFKWIATAEHLRREGLIFQACHDAVTLLPNRTYLSMNKDKKMWKGLALFVLGALVCIVFIFTYAEFIRPILHLIFRAIF